VHLVVGKVDNMAEATQIHALGIRDGMRAKCLLTDTALRLKEEQFSRLNTIYRTHDDSFTYRASVVPDGEIGRFDFPPMHGRADIDGDLALESPAIDWLYETGYGLCPQLSL